jgi:hypothetical protein
MPVEGTRLERKTALFAVKPLFPGFFPKQMRTMAFDRNPATLLFVVTTWKRSR